MGKWETTETKCRTSSVTCPCPFPTGTGAVAVQSLIAQLGSGRGLLGAALADCGWSRGRRVLERDGRKRVLL